MSDQECIRFFERLQAHWFSTPIPRSSLQTYADELRDLPYDVVDAALSALIRGGSPHVPLAGQVRRKAVELQLDAPTWVDALSALKVAVQQRREWVAPETCIDGNPDCDGDGWIIRDEEYEIAERRRCEHARAEATLARIRALREKGVTEPCPEEKCDGSGFVPAGRTRLHSVAEKCSCHSKLAALRTPNLNPVLLSFAKVVGWDEIERMLLGDSTAEAQMRNKYADHVRSLIERRGLIGVESQLPMIARANADLPASVPVPELRQITA